MKLTVHQCVKLKTSSSKSKLDSNHQYNTRAQPRVDVVKCDFPSTSGEEVIHGENLDVRIILTSLEMFLEVRPVIMMSSIFLEVDGQPIIYVLDNTFLGSTDDCLDLDGIDAHIEGNQFFNVHTDDPDRESSSSAIATDNNSHLTIVRKRVL